MAVTAGSAAVKVMRSTIALPCVRRVPSRPAGGERQDMAAARQMDDRIDMIEHGRLVAQRKEQLALRLAVDAQEDIGRPLRLDQRILVEAVGEDAQVVSGRRAAHRPRSRARASVPVLNPSTR